MSNSIVINLREAGRVDPGRWLTGPLRVIQLVTLGPAGQVEIAAEGVEHTLFTLRGTGTVTHGDTTVDLGPEVAVTLPLGTHVTVVAGPDGLEYFQASLEVPPETIAAPHDGRQGGER
jgi:mannose-6-phosphate isomerase-like protein (cupin superfamily)